MAALGLSSPPPLSVRRDSTSDAPSLVNATLIVGPLLVAYALIWALWGFLCLQLYLFLLAAARERSSERTGSSSDDPLPLPSRQRLAKKNEDVNPWTLDVIDRPTPNPPPLSINTHSRRSHIHPTGRQYDLRLTDTSFDPYAYHSSTVTSPITTDETPHGDRDRRAYTATPAPGGLSHYPSPSATALQNPPKKLSTIFSTTSQRAQSIAKSPCALTAAHAHPTVLTLYMLRSSFVRLIVFLLFLVVSVQVFVATAYIWRTLVHGWGASGSPGTVVVRDERLLAISSHILGALAFLLSMAFFVYRILLMPCLVALKANKAGSGSEVLGLRSGKGGKLLRPLSLVLKRRDSDTPRRKHGTGTGGPGLGGLYARGGHVQPIPSFGQKLWLRVKAAVWRFGSWCTGAFSSLRRDVTVQMDLGARDKLCGILELSFVVITILLIILVGVCGLIVGARAIGNPIALGSPRDFTGESAIWRAGEVALNACVCLVLLGLLFRSRELRISYPSWAVVFMRVVGESGVALLLVAILALGFTSSMTDGHNTISKVPGLILPALYANTVLLNVTQSSAFYVHRAVLRGVVDPSSPNDVAEKTLFNALGSSKSKDFKEASHAGDIEMGILAITKSSTTDQVVRLTRAENSQSSTDSSGSFPPASRSSGTGKEKDQVASSAGMHMERDTLGEPSSGMKRSTSIKSLRNDAVQPMITLGGMKPYHGTMNPNRLSGVSQDGLSLDLPVFRKGRRQYYNDYYNGAWDGYDDDYDDDEDDESYLSSEEGGTWDYGYAMNIANAERDRERDERERATQVAEIGNNSAAAAAANVGTTSANEALEIASSSQVGSQWRQQQQQQHMSLQVPFHTSPLHLQRKSFPSSPLSPHRRHSSLRHSLSRDNIDDVSDSRSMRSIGSRNSRRSRHRPFSGGGTQTYRHPLLTHHYSHLYDEPIPSSSSNVALNTGSFPNPNPTPRSARRLPATPSSYENRDNVLVISPDREPSIAELSLFKAASVAATRASTGSQWSSYTYPKPTAFPELDEDLQHRSGSYAYQTGEEGGTGVGLEGSAVFGSAVEAGDGEEAEEWEGEGEGGMIEFAECDPDATESVREASLAEQDIGDALYSLSGMGHARIGEGGPTTQRVSTYHPYASAALDGDGEERRMRDEDPARRRWRVHPLKRMVEKGRFKK